MNFPQYHVPTLPIPSAMFIIPAVFITLILALIVFTVVNAVKSKGLDKYDLRATVALSSVIILIFVGAVTVYYGATKPYSDAQEKATASAISNYHTDVASYIDKIYGVKITKASARDLVKGKETAGVAPTGETITLSLLNRDQKKPVLVGTDHNPIPEFDRQIAE